MLEHYPLTFLKYKTKLWQEVTLQNIGVGHRDAQWIGMLATEPDDWSLVPRIRMVKAEYQFLQAVL